MTNPAELPKKALSFLKIRKDQVWLSEIALYIFAIFLLVVPLFMGSIIIKNEFSIRINNRKITKVTTDNISLEHELQTWREKYTIAAVLDTFTRKRLEPQVIANLTEIVYKGAKRFGYDPFLVLAVINVESMFNERAMGQYRSGAYSGAFGLMQLKEGTAQEVAKQLGIPFQGIDDLMKPEINIALGIGYLTRMINRFKSLKLGISAYNQGPGTVLNVIKNQTSLSTRYYNKVLKSYYKLKEMQDSFIDVDENW